MAKAKKTRRSAEPDGVYILKLLLYILLGSFWLKLSNDGSVAFGVPLGFIAGLIFASHERFRLDRKIEYAALLIAMLLGYLAPYGLYINF